MNRLDDPGRELVQLLLAGAVDAPVATHPEIAPIILEDLENDVVKHSLPSSVGGKLAVLESAQPSGAGSNPKRPLVVLIDGAGGVMCQAVLGGIGFEQS